jgi:outer membrane protein
MKPSAITFLIAALGLAAGNAMAEPSPWLLRLRAVHISPANDADPIGGTGAADRLQVSAKTIPDLDVSYFFTPNIAAELVLTYPQKHDVTLDGANIGSFKQLPPTLSAQYHFAPDAAIRPYVGAGLNYTRISSVNLLGGKGGLDNSSVGLSLQAGADISIDPHWSFNVDIKKVRMRSDVTIAGATVSKVKIDPLLFGIGLGYRF